mmetsp:Transcript_59430/g.106021  ORF Transcript_59430/g.106021 Transcript_59430/m.106021 type:complete len:203 (+) Transcript_59430:501-1109(+)
MRLPTAWPSPMAAVPCSLGSRALFSGKPRLLGPLWASLLATAGALSTTYTRLKYVPGGARPSMGRPSVGEHIMHHPPNFPANPRAAKDWISRLWALSGRLGAHPNWAQRCLMQKMRIQGQKEAPITFSGPKTLVGGRGTQGTSISFVSVQFCCHAIPAHCLIIDETKWLKYSGLEPGDLHLEPAPTPNLTWYPEICPVHHVT